MTKAPQSQLHAGAKGHVPVLVDETIEALALRADGCYVDATYGRGGHARSILEACGPSLRLIVIDRDPEAIADARRLAADDARVTVIHADFREFESALSAQGFSEPVDGVLFDLGVSSPQLDDPARGFSVRTDGPLDMRMNPDRGSPVSTWLNVASRSEISRVIRSLGEEPAAGRIADAIVRERSQGPLETTGALAALIASVVPDRGGRIHPATRTFQALRIFVNEELDALREALGQAVHRLAGGGRLCVISFHSLEDRIVKRFMRDGSRVDPALAHLPEIPASARPVLGLVGRALRPGPAEVAANPRARSAVLRVAEKLA